MAKKYDFDPILVSRMPPRKSHATVMIHSSFDRGDYFPKGVFGFYRITDEKYQKFLGF